MWGASRRLIAPATSALGAAAAIVGGQRTLRCDEASFSKSEFRSFPILNVQSVSHDSKIITCALPSEQHVMGMSVSSLVMVNGEKDADGKATARPYTPISTDQDKGYFQLLVKGYPTGLVSKYLCSLQAGDSVELKGPFPKLPYKANMKSHIGMIAGGSGITPMFQVIKEILKDPNDKTKVSLIFANRTPADILLRKELDLMAKYSNGRLKVTYVVDDNSANDAGVEHVGFVTLDLVRKILPAPTADTLVYVCGPPPMVNAVAGKKGKPPAQGDVGGVLKEAGYAQEMVYKF